MQMNLYVLGFPFKNFCKLAKQTETVRNYQKRGLFMISFRKLANFQNKRKIVLVRADIIHAQREIEVLFSTLKNSPFPLISSEHKTTYKSPAGSYSLPYSLGATSRKNGFGCAARFPKYLPYLKVCDFPYPIYDLTNN